MKELKLKIKREYYNILKELNDRQAGELVKGMCAYMYDNKPFFTKDAYLKGVFMTVKRDIDEAKQNSVNGKKSAEVCAESSPRTGLVSAFRHYLVQEKLPAGRREGQAYKVS